MTIGIRKQSIILERPDIGTLLVKNYAGCARRDTRRGRPPGTETFRSYHILLSCDDVEVDACGKCQRYISANGNPTDL